MPDPSKFKNTKEDYKRYMNLCMHTTVHKEKKEKEHGVAQCLNMWRQVHGPKHPGKAKVADLLRKVARSLEMANAPILKCGTYSDSLTVYLYDKSAQKIDPYRLSYSIYEAMNGTENHVGNPNSIPHRTAKGEFYARVSVPTMAKQGRYVIKWAVQETESEPAYTASQSFYIVE